MDSPWKCVSKNVVASGHKWIKNLSAAAFLQINIYHELGSSLFLLLISPLVVMHLASLSVNNSGLIFAIFHLPLFVHTQYIVLLFPHFFI
jgi:hypothetical protein